VDPIRAAARAAEGRFSSLSWRPQSRKRKDAASVRSSDRDSSLFAMRGPRTPEFCRPGSVHTISRSRRVHFGWHCPSGLGNQDIHDDPDSVHLSGPLQKLNLYRDPNQIHHSSTWQESQGDIKKGGWFVKPSAQAYPDPNPGSATTCDNGTRGLGLPGFACGLNLVALCPTVARRVRLCPTQTGGLLPAWAKAPQRSGRGLRLGSARRLA